jgi:hypothetical protein
VAPSACQVGGEKRLEKFLTFVPLSARASHRRSSHIASVTAALTIRHVVSGK